MCSPNSCNDPTHALVRKIVESVEGSTGLHIVAGSCFLDLHRDDCATIARVDLTDDPVGDLDRLRECWTSLVYQGSNMSFD